MQYYVELEPKIPDAYFESSAFSEASDDLLTIAKRLGIQSHFDFFSFAAQNDMCPPEHREMVIPWFEPQAGIDWLEVVTNYIQSEPAAVSDPDGLLADFTKFAELLRQAQAKGSKWHFAMDI